MFFFISKDPFDSNNTDLKTDFHSIDLGSKIYKLYVAIISYLILGTVILLLFFNLGRYENIIAKVLEYYIIVPTVLAAIIIILVAMVLITMPFLNRSERRYRESNTRIKVAKILCRILVNLKKYSVMHLIPDVELTEISAKFSTASRLIREYPYRVLSRIPSQEIAEQFLQAANELDKIDFDLKTASSVQADTIKKAIVTYTNILLDGDLLALPKQTKIIKDRSKIRKTKLHHYLLLGIYLTLPIILAIGLDFFFKVTFSDYNQSLLKILYIIWACVGIFSNPIFLNNDNKDFIKDILKSWFGK